MATIKKTIQNLKPGKQYLLTVKPKDADINATLDPTAAVRFEIPLDVTQPANLGNLVIVGNYKSIMISFNPSNEADLKAYNYQVYLPESISQSGSTYVINSGATPYLSGVSASNVITVDVPQNSTSNTTVDANTGVSTKVPTNVVYFGRVQSVDTTGNTSEWTPIVASTATTLIDSAHIIDLTASKITAGTIGAHTITMAGVSSILKSSNYLAANTTFGGTGWKISGDGKAVFNEASIRSSLDIGEDLGTSDATSFHVDSTGNMWSGANSTSFAIAPFRVTNTGAVTAKTLTLTGNTVLSQTDNSKIYLGNGVYNNNNTPFYVDSASQFSLGNKLTWDGSNLTVSGNINITGGNVLTLIGEVQSDADTAYAAALSANTLALTANTNAGIAYAAALSANALVLTAQNTANDAYTTANTKITAGGAAFDINGNATTISGDKITTGSLNANRISGGTITASVSITSFGTLQAGLGSSDVGYAIFGQSGLASRMNAIGFVSTATSGWNTNFYPYTAGIYNCGNALFYWNNINYSGAVTKQSDRRIKTSIEDAPSVLGLIKALKPRIYLMKNSPGDSKVTSVDPVTNEWEFEPIRLGKRKHFGLIAQEVKEAFEQCGFPTDEYSGWGISDQKNPDSQQNISLDEFIGILLKAVQELSAKVNELESRLS